MSRACAPRADAHADFARALRDAERQHAEQADAGNQQRERAEPGEHHRVQSRLLQARHHAIFHRHHGVERERGRLLVHQAAQRRHVRRRIGGGPDDENRIEIADAATAATCLNDAKTSGCSGASTLSWRMSSTTPTTSQSACSSVKRTPPARGPRCGMRTPMGRSPRYWRANVLIDHDGRRRRRGIRIGQRAPSDEPQAHGGEIVRTDDALRRLHVHLEAWIARRPHLEGREAAGRHERQRRCCTPRASRPAPRADVRRAFRATGRDARPDSRAEAAIAR